MAEPNKQAMADWLRELAGCGLELWFEGKHLRFRAPKGALTPEMRSEISARKPEIIAHLRAEAAKQSKTLPLSFNQQSLWFLHQQAGESIAYHVPMSVRVLCPIEPEGLRQALQALVDRHPSLRTTYALVDGTPCQRVAGAGAIPLDVHEVAGLDDAALRKVVEADYARPFDLENGPVLRASLFTRGPSDHVFVLAIHHIAADGWSFMILFEELLKLYAEAMGGKPAGLARETYEYGEYAAWQQERLAGPEGERLWQYWKTKLAAPRALLELPSDRPRPAVNRFRGASSPVVIPTELAKQVKELARAEGTTPFVVLLAVFHALLARLTGQGDVTVGAPTLGRSKAEFMRVVGDFANPVALRARVDEEASFKDLVAQERQTVHEALEAQEMPLSLLVQRLQPVRDSSRSPLFDAFFTLQSFDQSPALDRLLAGGDSGLTLEAYSLPQQEGRFDLALELGEHQGELRGDLKYSADLFDPPTIERFAEGYIAIVEAVTKDPSILVGALPRPAVKAAGAEDRAGDAIAELLERLKKADIRVALENDKLKVNAPKGALTDELKTAIAASKEPLIEALRSGFKAASGGAFNGLRRVPRTPPLPVSSVQQRLWFLDRMQPGGTQYNVGSTFRFRGPLDTDILRRAIDALAARHESLRSRIGEREGAAEVEILEPASGGLEVVDLSHVSDAQAREQQGLRTSLAQLQVSFELAKGRLFACRLVRLATDDAFFTINMHHVISDGWSMIVAMREICSFYRDFAEGRSPELPPLALQYVDYAAWEREQLHAGRMARHLTFWKQQLAGAPAVLELPTDRGRPAAPTFKGRRVSQSFGLPLLEQLKQLGRQHESTLYMTMLAAWKVLLHRYSGMTDIVVGSPIANREHPALEGIIGCFVNNVVVRSQLHDNPRFVDLLAKVKDASLNAFDHGELPFDVLVNGLKQARSTDHAPVFQVLFTLHSFPVTVPAPPGLTLEVVEEDDRDGARFDLSIEVAEYGGRFIASYEYATDLFDPDTIERLHGHYDRLLHAIAAEPTKKIDDLPLLTGEDERLLLKTWNATAAEHDRSLCVHQLMEATAKRTPDAIAAIAGDTSLTYRELDARANRLARLLVKRGVAPGSLVAICVDRTLDMPVALAAVHKAGAAYVPLDPTHPADRLRYTLEDAGVAAAITLSRFAPLLAESGAPLVVLDESAAELEALPATAPGVTSRPEDRAYVIYTSGSTGRPKGVEVEHRNVVAFLDAMRREPGFTDKDVLLAVTTLSFDIAGLELWLPLSVGGKIVIASRTDVLDGERLMGMLEEHRVTVMQATPATWRLMLESGWTGKRDLKVLCGGEAMPKDLAVALTERIGELWNMYGPTETTIWSTVSRIHDGHQPITIGHPIHNTRVYVLEPSGQLAPIGIPGELCIGGEGVARGYHHRAELTAEKFVTITLPDGAAERVYRTGDLARFRADGRIDFLGRRDHQVKVRGYRIELGEIEAILATHPHVKECVVGVREDRPGDQRMIGYVVLEPGASFDPEAGRGTLRAKLPEYMIPNQFMVLGALPLTPNGKIDRKALPAPEASVTANAHQEEAEALMSPPQRRVAGVWRDVLRIERIGLHDNFFDVGGHSLLLVKLHASLKREFDTDVSLVELFQWTTIASQAARLSAVENDGAALRRAQARAAKQGHG